MDMLVLLKRLGWICLGMLLVACVVQTEQLEGLPGDRGELGPPGERGDEGPPGTVDGTLFMSAIADTGTTGSLNVDGVLSVNALGGAGDSFVLGGLGVGHAAPTATLHVSGDGDARVLIEDASQTDAARVLLELENTGPPRMRFIDSNGSTWNVGLKSDGSFRFDELGNAGEAMVLDPNGNLTLSGDLTIFGTCTGCDAVFDPGYPIDSIEAHAEEMWRTRYLPAVGPTPEIGPMNIRRKTAGMLNELEKAHIYIERLNLRLRNKERRVAELEQQLASLDRRLARLERPEKH